MVGHFSAARGSAYLNVFSCRPFDAGRAAGFVADFLGGKVARLTRLERY